MRVRRDALESELNDAMVELSDTDFLLANFDLQTLFLDSLGKYYSEDVVLWFQDELTQVWSRFLSAKEAQIDQSLVSRKYEVCTGFRPDTEDFRIKRRTRLRRGRQSYA